MSYRIEDKLVVAIASSALFDLSESDKVYREEGVKRYKKYQEEHMNVVLKKGIAFPFIKRLLSINEIAPDYNPIEVILLSRNDIETGMRVFRSISEYGLNITRAAFFSGASPYKYIPSFNASLFLSANKQDVRDAIAEGFSAGQVLGSNIVDDEDDKELRIAFDFDGVIASDESETIYKEQGMKMYHAYEKMHANQPLDFGPVGNLLQKISALQKLESHLHEQNENYKPIIRTSIVTARNAPAHERVVTTLKYHGIEVDEAFFLGGIEKRKVLNVIKPHIFFDDQKIHLKELTSIPAVHIPFGIANVK